MLNALHLRNHACILRSVDVFTSTCTSPPVPQSWLMIQNSCIMAGNLSESKIDSHSHPHPHPDPTLQLSKWHPIALGASVLDAVVERTGIDASLIDDVIVGCVSQAGAQAGNIGRNMVDALSILRPLRYTPSSPTSPSFTTLSLPSSNLRTPMVD